MGNLLDHPYVQLAKFAVVQYVGRRKVRVLATVLLVLFGAGASVKILRWLMRRISLHRRRLQKQRERKQAISSLANHLALHSQTTSEQREEIVKLPFTQLQAQLKSGHVTPSQALEAYQHKALEAHEYTNCIVDVLKEAKTWALELEAGDNKHLPLYGIPISLKDNYGVQGYDSVVGTSSFIGQKSEEDAVLVKVLKKQGAVPYVKTNVPQTLLIFETTNPIFGFTTNPVNQQRGAGGSSGGEGAIIGSGASPLGFGGDIGGSIRIPSAFCGIYGLKPTAGKISNKGSSRLMRGQTLMSMGLVSSDPGPKQTKNSPKRTTTMNSQELYLGTVCPSYGPMARDVDSLVEAMRALQGPLMWELDTKTPPTPFNEQIYGDKRPLKIGYYTYDGRFHAVPASERAVLEAAECLRAQGHEVVEWDMKPYAAALTSLWISAVYGDGCQELMEILADDAVDPELKVVYRVFSTNHTIKKIVAFLISRLDPMISLGLRLTCGSGSVSNWWKLATTLQDVAQEVLKDWQTQGLDVVLSPCMACPALPCGYAKDCSGVGTYTVVYNVLDCAVGSVPVTKVTSEDIERLSEYPTPDHVHAKVKEGQIGSEGMPVGVQVAALPWQDELCLRVMKELETALKH